MTINAWRGGIQRLWQERAGTMRKGNVTWCVLSPLPLAQAGICVGAFASGDLGVSECICCGCSSRCQLLCMTSESSQTSGGLEVKCSGHSAPWEQTVSQPAQDLEALTCLLNWAAVQTAGSVKSIQCMELLVPASTVCLGRSDHLWTAQVHPFTPVSELTAIIQRLIPHSLHMLKCSRLFTDTGCDVIVNLRQAEAESCQLSP